MEMDIVKYTINTASASVFLAFVSKKVFKKELLPVSGWKQMFTTYLTILGAGLASNAINKQIEMRNQPAPKPK